MLTALREFALSAVLLFRLYSKPRFRNWQAGNHCYSLSKSSLSSPYIAKTVATSSHNTAEHSLSRDQFRNKTRGILIFCSPPWHKFTHLTRQISIFILVFRLSWSCLWELGYCTVTLKCDLHVSMVLTIILAHLTLYQDFLATH